MGSPGAPGNIGPRGHLGRVGPKGEAGEVETLWQFSAPKKRLEISTLPMSPTPNHSQAQGLKQSEAHTNTTFDINNVDNVDSTSVSDNIELDLYDDENSPAVGEDYDVEVDKEVQGSPEVFKGHSSKEILDSFFDKFETNNLHKHKYIVNHNEKGDEAEERSALKFDSKSKTKNSIVKTTPLRRNQFSGMKVGPDVTKKLPYQLFFTRYFL